MSQYGEGTATQNIYVEKPKSKKEISVRLSLFYDGTLNNRVNIDAREKNSKKFEELQKRWFTSTASYDNGRTNIAIMEPHLLDTSDGYDIALKEYIEGQGTFDLKGDDFIGYSMGGLASGVAGRAVQGMERGLQLIAKNIDSNKKAIKKLTIDVFGFSRGAATARYAIYLLLKGSSKNKRFFSGGYTQNISPILEEIANQGIEIQETAVEICFAGLYDTVLSYYGSQELKFEWVGNWLQQKSVKLAKKVLHLTAADEHRVDFPLHNIKSAGSKGEEYYLPGVHADVGGSYNKASEFALQAETDPNKKVYMKYTREKDLIILRGSKKELERDREQLIEQVWYKKNEITVKTERHGRSEFHHLLVNRENISSAYCNIPLKIMAKYARDDEVKLKLNNKLDRRADIILEPHSDLAVLETEIKKYMADKKGNGVSKADDWLADNTKWNKFLMTNKIRNKHFNFSSHPGLGYSPRIEKGKRTRYVYKA